MSLKVLGQRFARPIATPAKPDTEALDRARREVNAAKAAAERSAKETAEALKVAAAAQADRDRFLLDSALTGAASKARAINPQQVNALLRDRFELVEGKVRPKDKPEADVDAYIGEWLGTDGKHFLPASVPSGGAGAPSSPQAPRAAAPHDLTTSAGMTAYAREREASAKR